MSKGYVYILTNPCIQYTYREDGKEVTISPVKIGMAKELAGRVGPLNTSLPENFVHHMSVLTEDMKAVENVAHLCLDKCRIKTKEGEKTEFFICTVKEAMAALKRATRLAHVAILKIDKTKIIGRSSWKIKANSKAAREAKLSRENAKVSNATERRSLPVRVSRVAKPVSAGWKNSTQLAKAIVEKYNGGKSKGNLWHILNRNRPVAPSSKWRSILEGIGLTFDKDNLVVDWSAAKM